MHLFRASGQQPLRQNRAGDGQVKSHSYEDVDIATTRTSRRRFRGPDVELQHLFSKYAFPEPWLGFFYSLDIAEMLPTGHLLPSQ